MKNTIKVIFLVIAALVTLIATFVGNGKISADDDISIIEDNLPDNGLNYWPTSSLGDELITHTYLSLSYSKKHKNPEWVAYELKGSWLHLETAVSRGNFTGDPATKAEAKVLDYAKSGYDRGHLAPAADMNFDALAMKECFYITNISPQVPGFNRGIWKELESKVRHWATQNRRVYIVTGPILRRNPYSAPRLLDSKTAPTIPRGFYKVILDYDSPQKKGIAFLFKNKEIDQDLKNFVVTIDQVEKYTRLDFFPDLSPEEQNQLEAIADPSLWGL